MRHLIQIFSALLISHLLPAQEPDCTPGSTSAEEPQNRIYEQFDLDHGPSFPGGEASLLAWLEECIRYPPEAWRDSIQGTALVSFIVEKDGSLSHIQLCRDPGGGCGAEALRVVGCMPNWWSGTIGNDHIRTWVKLPIRFRMARFDPARDFGDTIYEQYVGGFAVSPKGTAEQFTQFLSSQKRLLRRLRRATDQPVVVVYFVVEKDGSLSSYPGPPAGTAQQILFEAAQALGKWQPLTKQGKPVRSSGGVALRLRKPRPVQMIGN
ncbi:MAG: energy transducer TonB [Saprospiraceae bacterium]|nr:energy transducer TonB [Saprospiraceae bacterium]